DPTSDNVTAVGSVLVLPPPSNDIVISGVYGTPPHHQGFVAALHEDGTFDGTFASNGRATILIPGTSDLLAEVTAVNQGGKLLVAGAWRPLAVEESDFWVARLDRNAIFGDDFEGVPLRLWSNHADP